MESSHWERANSSLSIPQHKAVRLIAGISVSDFPAALPASGYRRFFACHLEPISRILSPVIELSTA